MKNKIDNKKNDKENDQTIPFREAVKRLLDTPPQKKTKKVKAKKKS